MRSLEHTWRRSCGVAGSPKLLGSLGPLGSPWSIESPSSEDDGRPGEHMRSHLSAHEGRMAAEAVPELAPIDDDQPDTPRPAEIEAWGLGGEHLVRGSLEDVEQADRPWGVVKNIRWQIGSDPDLVPYFLLRFWRWGWRAKLGQRFASEKLEAPAPTPERG